MRRAARLAALLGGSFVLALLCGDLMLRAIGYSVPIWYEPHHALGWVLRPNVAAWFTSEGRAYVQVNSSGLRDRESPVDKAAEVYRIAVLGDSYSEAMQVAQERAYWALLPKELAACGFASGKRIEAINFGVSGYGTAQEYLMLETRAARYRPDLVLLQFTNGNDVKNNSFALEEEKGRPFFKRGPGGELVLDRAFAASRAFRDRTSGVHELLRKLADHSRVVQLARAVKERGILPRAAAAPNAGVEAGLDVAPLAPPRDGRWSEAWDITEALIARTGTLSASLGSRFLVVTVPFAIQVHPDPALRSAVRKRLDVPDLFYPEHRLAEFGKRSGISVVALAPDMQRHAQATGTFLHGFKGARLGFGHWNEAGHELAAKLIARYLCARQAR